MKKSVRIQMRKETWGHAEASCHYERNFIAYACMRFRGGRAEGPKQSSNEGQLIVAVAQTELCE